MAVVQRGRRRGKPRRWRFLVWLLAAVWVGTSATSALARDAYVADEASGTVSVINTQINQVVGSPIGVGKQPYGIAITPDGSSAYVTNNSSENVSVINTQTNQVVSSPIKVGTGPTGIAITPDGSTAYVTNEAQKTSR